GNFVFLLFKGRPQKPSQHHAVFLLGGVPFLGDCRYNLGHNDLSGAECSRKYVVMDYLCFDKLLSVRFTVGIRNQSVPKVGSGTNHYRCVHKRFFEYRPVLDTLYTKRHFKPRASHIN
ncbi:MAG: hypothetical protein AAGU75_20370, partial [Bacillota bacterium]